MTIGAYTFITIPLRSGYLSYLATIESWAKVVDQFVVVDGGSVDGSLDLLSDWIRSANSNIKIISTKESAWGEGDRWYWPQLSINAQIGFDHMNTDWVVRLDADHVLHDMMTRNHIQSALDYARGCLVVSMQVDGFNGLKYISKRRTRKWVVNRTLAMSRGLQLGFGIDANSDAHLDYPILKECTLRFLDPQTSYEKTYYKGQVINSEREITISTVGYGHFFFNRAQCYDKCRRIDEALMRYLGRAPSRRAALLTENKIPSVLQVENKPFSKKEVLSWPHPHAVKRIIEEFYSPQMIAGCVTPNSRAIGVAMKLMSIERRIRTVLLRRRGLVGGKDLEEQNQTTSQHDQVIDVADLYRSQNMVYGSRTNTTQQ